MSNEHSKESVKQIKEMFSLIPPDYEEIEKMLSAFSFDKKELAEIAVHVVDDCFAEKGSMEYENECYGMAIRPFEQCHSNYLYDSMKLLLRHGLDPNVCTEDDNLMYGLQYVDFPDVGAKTLRLLLEHGGNPNIILPDESETMFEDIDFKVTYDMYEHQYLPLVQCWWLLIGYGARLSNGKQPIKMLNNNSAEILKKFEEYDYYIENNCPHDESGWIMHIFNKNTKEEIARL